MTTAYGQVTTGYWPAVVIGLVMLVVLIATTVVAVRRRHRAATPSAPPTAPPPGDADVPRERCRVLIAEALIVRERMSGRIDAPTYQERMNDLVSRGHGGADHVER